MVLQRGAALGAFLVLGFLVACGSGGSPGSGGAAGPPGGGVGDGPVGAGAGGSAPGLGGSGEATQGGGGGVACRTSPATVLAASAVCVCEELSQVGTLRTVAPPGGVASVGVNGKASGLFGGADGTGIDGTLAVGKSFSPIGHLRVRDDLVTGTNLDGTATLLVGRDARIGGDLSWFGTLKVAGALAVAGKTSSLGTIEQGRLDAYVPPAGPPCPCAPGQKMDVAKMVAAARAANDNTARNIPPLDTFGAREVPLDSGRYFFSDVDTLGKLRVHVRGAVEIFLEGDFEAVGDQRFVFDKGATLDLYVSGSVRTLGTFAVENLRTPTDFRLYVGGKDSTISTIGKQKVVGIIYAPTATVSFLDTSDIEGAVFARQLHYTGDLVVHYGGPSTILPAESCRAPGGSSGAPAAPPEIIK